MTCGDYRRLLHEYFAGDLAPEEAERLEAHRKDCPDCDALMKLALETTCKDVTELLNDYVEETLPAGRREVFERHFAICPDCTAYLQSYRATMRMSALALKPATRRLAEALPDSLVDAILAALAEDRQRSR